MDKKKSYAGMEFQNVCPGIMQHTPAGQERVIPLDLDLNLVSCCERAAWIYVCMRHGEAEFNKNEKIRRRKTTRSELKASLGSEVLGIRGAG